MLFLLQEHSNFLADFDHTRYTYFYVLLTVHLSISLNNEQLDAHLVYFTIRPIQSSTCFEHYMLIIRRLKSAPIIKDVTKLYVYGIYFLFYLVTERLNTQISIHSTSYVRNILRTGQY